MEKELLCAICQEPMKGLFKGRMNWYCNDCYHTYYDDIMNNTPWVRLAVLLERRRRRNELSYGISNKPPGGVIRVIYLEDKYDITNDGRLVVKEGYYGSR